MSTAFPKTKEKRARSSSESNKSFVQNVTSRVSGLLPATIAKWFSSPSSSTNGSAQVADATDSSTEDEASESPVAIQPPAKRMRYTSPGNVHQEPVETRCTGTNTESIDEPYTLHSPIARSGIRRENNLMSTLLPVNDESTDQTVDSFFKSQHSLTAIGHSRAKKRKSLFDTPQDESKQHKSTTGSANVRDPYFKPSLLSSPFYAGRTMYGGAAASSYVSLPSFKQRKISLTNETRNNDVTMSQSARRVLDLLEHYSSPLIEAKRIPQIIRKSDEAPNISSQQSYGGNRNAPKVSSYKTQELHVPSIASIITIKRKCRLMDTTNAARQIIASHSSSSEYIPFSSVKSAGDTSNEVSGDKLTTKVKSRLTRTNRDRNINMECNTTDTVDLPTGVLQIDKDNLPKFTFEPPQSSQSSHSSSIETSVIMTPEAVKLSVEADKLDTSKINVTENNTSEKGKNSKEECKFSMPVQISNESAETSSAHKFTFGSPERNLEKLQEVKNKDEKPNTSISNQINVDNKLSVLNSDWKCGSCWVKNKIDVDNCVCCNAKKPIENDDTNRKCCVCNISLLQPQCDKCTECQEKTNNIDKSLAVKETNSLMWKCNDCWVENNETVDKCVCCGGSNPKKTVPLINAGEKTAENDWKCNDCWIKNKSTSDKCVACGGSNPGSKPADLGTCTNIGTAFKFGISALPKSDKDEIKVTETSDNAFKDIAKAQSEKWECPLCLVRNERNRTTCICCQADKPGAAKECKPKFNFHQPTEITFKFGIQPNKPETAIETEESNMSEDFNETNNNILPKAPMFNFGLSIKKPDELSQTSVDISADAPKINFKFGIPNQIPVSPPSNTIFTIPSNSTEPNKKLSDEKETLQEVPRMFIASKTDEPPNPIKMVGLFNTQVAPEMPALVPLNVLNQPSSNKRDDISFTNTSVTPSTNSDPKSQQNSFTFVPATNFFATPSITTTSTSSVLPAPLASTPGISTISPFQKPNDVTTVTTPFFQNSGDSVPSVTGSLFLKTETTTTTTAPASLGIAQPLFSFGSQNQSSSAQPEKPKFNFTFGSNKTEPSSIFKPNFGIPNDNNASNIKFNIPSNTVTGGNTIAANPLQVNTTTQLNVANALTSGSSITTTPAPSIFGSTVQKENVWSANNNNIFATNTATNAVQKPPAFTFGSVTPFNANNNTFGNTTQPTQPSQPAPNVFGITNQTTASQTSMFASPLQNQSTPNIFGSTQAPNNPMPMGIFGTPNAGVAPSFGTSNPQIPSLAPAPAPTPAFNFGGQAPAIFGFGQQPQQPSQTPQQPEGQPAPYNFGANVPVAPQMFSIGTAPSNANTSGRHVRKAKRRTQR